MRDEDFLSKLGANPLQEFRRKALEVTLKVIRFLYDQTGKPVPTKKLEAELDIQYGYYGRKVREYLLSLENGDRIVWDRNGDTVAPKDGSMPPA